MPEAYRCFLAVDLADDVRREVVEARRTLEATDGDVRWTRPEGLHATLKFLGDVAPERVDAVARSASVAIRGEAPFAMRVRGVGGFPSLSRPRVLWVGLDAPALARLACLLDEALVGLGFRGDDKPFRPHLTLGRVRSLRRWSRLRDALVPLATRDFGESRVDRVVLYRSHLQPGGSVYEALQSLALSGAGAKEEGAADGHRQ